MSDIARPTGEHIFNWLLMALVCVPWLAMGSASSGWSLAAAAVAAVGLRSPFVARVMAPGAAAVCAYGGAATWPGADWLLLAYLGAFLMALRADSLAQRGPVTLLAACVGSSLVTVAWVLNQSHWVPEADRLQLLIFGLTCGGTLYVLGRRIASTSPRAVSAFFILVALVAGVRQFVWPASDGPKLPAWREVARGLGEPVGMPPRAALPELERLRMVGAQDAAMAWVGVALADNAAAEDIAPFCLDGQWTGTLYPGWTPWVKMGEQACAAAKRWPPEAGAAILADTDNATLMRVRGDLLMAAGDVPAAVKAYAQATARGDRFAQHDAAMGLLLRGLGSQAAHVAAADDIFLRSQLQDARADAAMWKAWNHALDFTTLSSPSRSGVVTRVGAGSLLNMHEPVHFRRVLATLPKDPARFSIELPLPPGQAIPGRLTLRVQMRRLLSVHMTNDQGETLIYTCVGEADNPLVKSLGPAVCNGSWADVTVEPAQALSGRLTRFALVGEFALAYVSARPAEETP